MNNYKVFGLTIIERINEELDKWGEKISYNTFISKLEPYNKFIVEEQFIPLVFLLEEIISINHYGSIFMIDGYGEIKYHLTLAKNYYRPSFNEDLFIDNYYQNKIDEILKREFKK